MPFLVSVVRPRPRGRNSVSRVRADRRTRDATILLGSCAAIVAVLLSLVACGGGPSEPSEDSAEPPIFGQGAVEIETESGSVELDVEIAETPEARQRGIMERTSLPSDAGMIFVYGKPVVVAFTMRNTLIPLSIAFMDGDGRILHILDMEPCASETCPSYNPELMFTTALEVNQGAFERLGVELGDLVRLERQ